MRLDFGHPGPANIQTEQLELRRQLVLSQPALAAQPPDLSADNVLLVGHAPILERDPRGNWRGKCSNIGADF